MFLVIQNTEWEQKFRLTTVHDKDRSNSDHTIARQQQLFKFERGWLIREGFYELIANKWQSESKGTTAIEKWQNKIRTLRQFYRGWAKNTAGHNKKEKKKLILMIDDPDKRASLIRN